MIPVFDNKRQNAILKKELDKALGDVIDRGIFILGPRVDEFEQKFAKYIGINYAVGVASGTDALMLSLLALGVRAGDEVIMPANSYPTAFSVTSIGAVPKLVDIDHLTFNINPKKIEVEVTKKTKAIIAVHLYGQPADMTAIMAVGRKYKIVVIEDCAQAHGATLSVASLPQTHDATLSVASLPQTHDATLSRAHPPPSGGAEIFSGSGTLAARTNLAEVGSDFFAHLPNTKWSDGRAQKAESSPQNFRKSFWKKAGSIGDFGCFSFYPTKNLGCFGDGGMVVTNNEELYKKIKLLRMYGERKRYESVLLGRNSRLDELQAAILLVKLKYLDRWVERRREIAKLYYRNLEPVNIAGPVTRVSQDSLQALSRESYDSNQTNIVDIMNNAGNKSAMKLALGARARATRNVIYDSIILPYESKNVKHAYHLYVIRTKKRDELKEYLIKNGVGTSIHYPSPIHLVPSFKYLGYKKGDFPEAESASREILSLPMYPEIYDKEVQKICRLLNNFS